MREEGAAARYIPYAFTAPVLLVVVAIYLTPIILGFVLSFSSWGSYSDEIRWVGSRNFGFMLDDAGLRTGLFATLKFAAAFTLIANGLALLLALLLEKTSRLNGFFRSALFVPVLVSPLAAGYLFRGVLNPSRPVNGVLSLVFFWTGGVDICWLGEPDFTIFVLSAVQAWKLACI